MKLFLVIWLSLLGGMNGYVLWKLRVLLPGPPAAVWTVVALGWTWGVAGFPLVWFAGRELPETVFRYLLLACVWWLALAFWMLFLFAGADLWNLLAGWRWPDWRLAARPMAFAVLGLAALAALAGSVLARRPVLRTLEIRTARLPAGTAPIRVVFLSDCHYGMTTPTGQEKRIRDLVLAAKPDLLLGGGDFIDICDGHARECLNRLAEIPSPLGRFGVLGNHEMYAGAAGSERLLRDGLQMTILRGQSADVGDHLRIVGVDDPGHHNRPSTASPRPDNLPGHDPGRFTILLKHQPVIGPGTAGTIDLQLSGHTHGGQIFPFNWLVRLQYPHPDGHLVETQGVRLYVSRGAGTWGPPLRLFHPGEVTLVILKPE
jgi:predicted MPP superfamily phosphohydrolase